MPLRHSMSCPWPEGCDCGASEWNELERKKNFYFDKIKELQTRLEPLAAKKVRSYKEDFCAQDYAGGNFDDAWSMGMEDGERALAQELLEILNKPLDNPTKEH